MRKTAVNIAGSVFLLVTAMISCKTESNIPDNQLQVNTEPVKDTIRLVSDTITNNNRNRQGELVDHPVKPVLKQKPTKDYYETAFKALKAMLEGREAMSFKRAVFITENAYFSEKLSYEKFNTYIKEKADLCRKWMKANKLNDYNYDDSLNFRKNAAIFTLMKDTVTLIKDYLEFRPYEYDFNDFLGEKEWSNQFVMKLLATGSGNCHSLPYLYKILADELKATAWLSIAPNHLYIKNYSRKWGWYNTELTSGEFPTDAWVKASGYITLDAIRNRIYMDTLGKARSIALCVYDLAKGYIAQTDNYTDGFVLKCCDLVLTYHSENINAIILKAETLRHIYEQYLTKENTEKADQIQQEMTALYTKGLAMGYREMPKQMYLTWLTSIKDQREKYVNTEIQTTIKTSNP